MRKIWTLAIFAALSLLPGCKGEDDPEVSVSFRQPSYTLYNGGQVSIGAAVDNPVPQNLGIPLEVDGPAGSVEIVPQEITIPAGETFGGILISDKSLSEGDRLTFTLLPPEGYTAGRRGTAVVTYDPREALHCSIPSAEYTFSDGMELVVEVTGARSGAEFTAEDDILIPAYIRGDGVSADGSNEIKFQEGGFIVEKGSNMGKGHLVRRFTNAIERPMAARIGIVDFDDTRILSTGPSILIHIPKTEK